MAAPISGQVAVSTSAQALSAAVIDASAFTIKASGNNSASIYIGPAGVTASTGYELVPGDTFEYEKQVQNGQVRYELRVSDFFVIGTGGSVVSWLASP